MLDVLFSIASDFAGVFTSLLQGRAKEVAILVVAVSVLKIASTFLRNGAGVDRKALTFASKADTFSKILSLDWEHYSSIMRHILTGRGYRVMGASLNELAGVDFIAEKDNRRTVFKFGRSINERISDATVSSLQAKAKQLGAENGCIVSCGTITARRTNGSGGVPIEIVERDEFVGWLNEHAGSKLPNPAGDFADSGNDGANAELFAQNQDIAA